MPGCEVWTLGLKEYTVFSAPKKNLLQDFGTNAEGRKMVAGESERTRNFRTSCLSPIFPKKSSPQGSVGSDTSNECQLIGW